MFHFCFSIHLKFSRDITHDKIFQLVYFGGCSLRVEVSVA